MVDNSTDPNYLDEVDTPLSKSGRGEYNNVEQTLRLVTKNVGRLCTNQREVQRIMRATRKDFYEFRDRIWPLIDAFHEGNTISVRSWIMVRLSQLSSRLTSHMLELEAHGVLPEYIPPCEECSGSGMVAHTERREGVLCPKCDGAGFREE